MKLRNGKTYSIDNLKKITDKNKQNIKIDIVGKNDFDDTVFTQKVKDMLYEHEMTSGLNDRIKSVIKIYKYILEHKEFLESNIKFTKFIKTFKHKYDELLREIEIKINEIIGEELSGLNREFIALGTQITQM